MLLRGRSSPVAYVVAWNASDDSVLWVDKAGGAHTSFVSWIDGKPVVGVPHDGFVI